MLVYIRCAPIWRPKYSVNIWKLLWLSRRLIICTEQTSIYINTFANPLTSKKATNPEIGIYFFDKCDRSFVSRTALTLKLKMLRFPNEARY